MPATRLREIDPNSDAEINLVAERMGKTLQEVLGEERGTEMYSRQWLVDRVRWHLSGEVSALVLVAEDASEKISGHAIARIEIDDTLPLCLFSTIYVEPTARGTGLAGRLMERVEAWARQQGSLSIRYNTAHDHTRLIGMFERRGFSITLRAGEMVQLTKAL